MVSVINLNLEGRLAGVTGRLAGVADRFVGVFERLADGISLRLWLPHFTVDCMNTTARAILIQLEPLRIVSPVLGCRIGPLLALITGKVDNNPCVSFSGHYYSIILVKVPAPTVRPPSRIANRNPASRATG
jgi:hypothetical protein